MAASLLQSALDATNALHNTLHGLDSSMLCCDTGTITLILRRIQHGPHRDLELTHERVANLLEALRNQADRIKDDMKGANLPRVSVSDGLQAEVGSLFLKAALILVTVVTTAMFVLLMTTKSSELLTLSFSEHDNVDFSPDGHREWTRFVAAAQKAAQDELDHLDYTSHLRILNDLLMGDIGHGTGNLAVVNIGSGNTQWTSRPLARVSDLLQVEILEITNGSLVTSNTDSRDTQLHSRQSALERLQIAMQEVRNHGIYRPDIIDEAVGQLHVGMSCPEGAAQVSIATSTADLTLCTDSFSLLNRLHNQIKEQYNWFTNIQMAEYTTLALLSPYTPATFQHIRSGEDAYQYIHGYHLQPARSEDDGKVTTLPVVESETLMQRLARDLPDFVSRFPRNQYRLQRQRTNVFCNLELAEREVVLILSCTEPIIVDSVSGKEGSVFIAGQITRQVLESIAGSLGIDFDAFQADGVFKTAAR